MIVTIMSTHITLPPHRDERSNATTRRDGYAKTARARRRRAQTTKRQAAQGKGREHLDRVSSFTRACYVAIKKAGDTPREVGVKQIYNKI